MEFVQGKWDLSELYPEDYKAGFERDLAALKQKVEEFKAYREELTPDIAPERFRKIMQDIEAMSLLSARMGGFCELRFSADTQNTAIMSLMAQTEAELTELANQMIFFDLWWKDLSNEAAAPLLAACPESAYYLSSKRLFKPYTLSEAEEKIINLKDTTGGSALNNIYSALTNRYVFKLNVHGKEEELTREGLMTYARSEERELRKAAYEELYRVYGQDGNILGQIYQSLSRDWDTEGLSLRGYATPISIRNLGNDIPDEVVDLLLKTCQKNKDVFIDYFKLKKELLGLDEMHRYDLYAPIHADESKVSFDEAYKTVLDSYREFDPEFAEMAERVYKENHIDSEIRHGKRGGAFCATLAPCYTPWVLTNFQGKNEDISTLAHELGHAIHSMSAEKRNIFEQGSCLPLAETASTFGEMLLSDSIEKRTEDKNVLLNMLMKQIDDNYATIQRQAYFAMFEKEAHEMITSGADVDMLNEAYLKNLRDQFGDAMVVDDHFKWEWVSIPHIFESPFYVYAYAFGQLLVLALYHQYKVEGASFIPRYKAMLEKGGSQKPAELLLDAGFDFTKESFWQGGFDILRGKVERIKALTR